MCTKIYLKGLATESILFKQNHLYTFTIAWHFFLCFETMSDMNNEIVWRQS